MKKMMTMIMVTVVCLGASKVWALDIDGYVKAVIVPNYYLGDNTANLLPGAVVDGYTYVYADGVLNIKLNKDEDQPYVGPEVIGGQVNLYSGIVKGARLATLSELNIYGGDLETVQCDGENVYAGFPSAGVINVYGSDFVLNGTAIETVYGYGTVTLNAEGYSLGNILTGTLSTGESLDLSIDLKNGPVSVTINVFPSSTSPADMLSSLGQFIDGEVTSDNIDPVLAVSLMAKINAASSALARGNPNDAKTAMNDLKALINQVEAQMDKKIDPITAQAIIDNANQIIAALGG